MHHHFAAKAWFVLALALLVIGPTGCSSSTGPAKTTTGSGSSEASAQPTSMRIELVEQWLDSAHSKPVTFAAEENGCMNCHDGQKFTETGGGFVPRLATGGSAIVTGLAGARDWVVATDCRVCHTGPGVDFAKSGTIDIPGKQVSAGVGAVCIACHNGWHGPGKTQTGGQRAPHLSVQADAIFVSNVATVSTSAQIDTRSPHQKVQDVCVGCHVTGKPVPGDKASTTAPPNHSMKIRDTSGCQGTDCHKTDPLQAIVKDDLDGNGTKETLQLEVDGLLASLHATIESHAGGSFESTAGAIVFAKGAKPSDADYAAAYNYLFVVEDRSRGAHSPLFIPSLLQQSIASLKKP